MRRVERYAAGLARCCVGHRGLVCLLWLAVLLVGGAASAAHLDRLDQSFTASGQDGSRANAAIIERYGSGAGVAPLVAVVTWPDGARGRSPAAAARLSAGVAASTPPGTRVLSYAETGDPAFLSPDGRTAYALVHPRVGRPDLAGLAAVADATTRLRTGLRAALPEARVNVTGVLPLQQDSATARPGLALQLARAACVLAAVALLVLVLRPLLSLLALLLTAVSSVAALLVVLALAGSTELSFVVVYLIPVAALALSVRRAALLVGAWRAELAGGSGPRLAAHRAASATAGTAALGTLAGGAAFASLAVFPVPFLRSIGVAGAAVCGTAALAALTLAPALLSWLPGRAADRPPAGARRRTPRLLAFGVLVALGLLTGAAGLLTAGNPRAEALVAHGPARDGLDQLTAAGIPSGVLNPLDVQVPSGAGPDRVAAAARMVPGVLAAAAPRGAAWRHDGSALVAVVPTAEPMTPAGRRTMADVRSALAGTGALVGGSGVPEPDLVHGVYRAVPAALVAVGLVGFLVVGRVRSAGTALRAVLCALVPAVAACGLLVPLWQYGAVSWLLQVPAAGAVTGWVPLVVGAFGFLDALDRYLLASGPGGHTPRGGGLVVALPLLAIGLGPQVELAVLVTGLSGAALLGPALFHALATLRKPALPRVPERPTKPTTSDLPATPPPSYWSRPRLPRGHTIPLAEPSGHGQ
ncbi:MMPL family transporter [Streptomyces sp. NPDC001691]|uniref:MMPL family transporter n=1 Tax=Streptomyces sp. NPDC001691 TaxID=3364600 RepID=UPI00368F9294